MKQTYEPLSKEALQDIKEGDVIERMLGFIVPCYFIVSEVTENEIISGAWTFNRNTGIEIDEDIPTPVSYIRKVLTEEEKKIIKSGGKLG